jgi:hypothetical protein
MGKRAVTNQQANVPHVSVSSNSWNQAAVRASAENEKLPSRREKLNLTVTLTESKRIKAKLTTNEWNLKALERLR